MIVGRDTTGHKQNWCGNHTPPYVHITWYCQGRLWCPIGHSFFTVRINFCEPTFPLSSSYWCPHTIFQQWFVLSVHFYSYFPAASTRLYAIAFISYSPLLVFTDLTDFYNAIAFPTFYIPCSRLHRGLCCIQQCRSAKCLKTSVPLQQTPFP